MNGKNKYMIRLSGEREGQDKMLVAIIRNSAGLSSCFVHRSSEIDFYFRFRGDARLVLKRIGKQFSARPEKDTLNVGGAVASVIKKETVRVS